MCLARRLNLLQYIHTLAAQTNSVPLPAVPEVFGVRLPPAKECLTAVDFDLVPNKPPPAVVLYEEEEVEVDDDEEEEIAQDPDADMDDQMEMVAGHASDQDGDIQDADEDGLFAGDDDEDDEDAMEQVETAMPPPTVNGHEPPRRELVEEDDYD